MDVIMDFVRAAPGVVLKNSWIIVLVLVLFALGLLLRYIVTSDRRLETALRINSIDEYIDKIKGRETDAD